MHEVVGARGCLRRDHNRQRLVVHVHELCRILGDRATFGDHERDRLARVAHDLGGEASLCAAVGEVGMRDEDGQIGFAEGQVLRGVNGKDARQHARRAYFNGPDARVRVRRAHQYRLERTVVDVVSEAPFATQQAVVLGSLHPFAEPAGGHRESSAARRTARRIDA